MILTWNHYLRYLNYGEIVEVYSYRSKKLHRQMELFMEPAIILSFDDFLEVAEVYYIINMGTKRVSYRAINKLGFSIPNENI